MLSQDKLYVNGRFLTQPLSGMQRYAEQLCGALDAQFAADPALAIRYRPEVLVPTGSRREHSWRVLRVREVGQLRSHVWEQTELAFAARDGILVNLIAAGPLLHSRSILALHDAAVFAHPEHFSKSYRALHQVLRPRLARRAVRLVTISEFSRRELSKWLRIPEGAFTIIPDSAEHILHVESDTRILSRYGLEPHRYALTVGNQTPNKNIALALRAFVQASPEGWQIAVAGGGASHIFAESETADHPAVRKVGRVTDEELRALYENAGMFLFPSRYEGFGVPPLEAMSLGCPVISSNASAMIEVLADAAYYFQSDDRGDLAHAIAKVAENATLRADLAERGLARSRQYTWRSSAETLLDLIGAV
ncbi:glycosyltransferase family 4 protein [Xanthobacter flavus]|uniref:glycosyltransferase family 4 protein n=1 Tax=Xanthobacter flavus TaxID=281 RepID=UPI001AE3A66D|nr:glycosyltransferase family 1 protein [Xanthobacter flavus]MBP2151677.1 glycosyltransferase involved in cell wall biosynthesis [Xanthobacter flavus]